jgi:hypothetical protein
MKPRTESGGAFMAADTSIRAWFSLRKTYYVALAALLAAVVGIIVTIMHL